eukprot:COSAG05_NODE_390_length_10436_cov_15.721196_8_plen_133_part_00
MAWLEDDCAHLCRGSWPHIAVACCGIRSTATAPRPALAFATLPGQATEAVRRGSKRAKGARYSGLASERGAGGGYLGEVKKKHKKLIKKDKKEKKEKKQRRRKEERERCPDAAAAQAKRAHRKKGGRDPSQR